MKKNNVEYKLLEYDSAHSLTIGVQEHLDNGWQLYGIPFGYVYNSINYNMQAVVRIRDDNPS